MTDGLYPVTVPKWGIEMQEGTIVSWHAEEGGEVTRGDELIDIETDKIVKGLIAATDLYVGRTGVQNDDRTIVVLRKRPV